MFHQPIAMKTRRRVALIVLAVGIALGSLGFLLRSPNRSAELGSQKRNDPTPGRYVTSSQCQGCHPRQHSSWHDSWHRTMTQEATSESVVAPFDNVRLQRHGEVIDLSRKDNQFFATRVQVDGEQERRSESRQIVMTTGSHLMQTYWVKIGSEFRQLPWFFHIQEQMWIPSADTFLNPPPGDQNSGRWNNTCIKCHTTGGVPGFDGTSFNTTVAELGIACEACHGPGDKHIAWHQESHATELPNAEVRLVNPAELPNHLGSQICGQCHSSSQARDQRRWLAMGSRYRPGDDHTREFRHAEVDSGVEEDQKYLKDSFWADGTCRVGGDEYLGISKSACFQKGKLSCMTCHSMHNSDPTDQLRDTAKSNEVCLTCHSRYRVGLEQHTHHNADSAGSNCYNCHMPHTSFALMKAIRSHRIDIPETGHSTIGSRPNACNLCHLDRPLNWTAERLADWYGRPPTVMDEIDRTTSAAVLWLLRGDAMQRVITAWHMGWEHAQTASGSRWQAPLLAQSLSDSYSVIRFVAWRSVRNLPGFQSFSIDYPGDDKSQSESLLRVIDFWKQTPVDILNPEAVLITPEGALDTEAVRRLRSQRDDEPIVIYE